MNLLFSKIKKSLFLLFKKGKSSNGLWRYLINNPEKMYMTEAKGKVFKVVIQDNFYKILRIDENKKFYVKQRLKKTNLLDAFELKPSCLADISEKTRGASYCYAIIKDYLNS